MPTPHDVEPEVVEVRLPRRYLVGGAVVLAFVVCFAMVVGYTLVHMLQTIEDTDRKIQGLNRSVQPLARAARDDLPAGRRQTARTRELLKAAQPIADDIGPLLDELEDRGLLARGSRTLGSLQSFLVRAEALRLLPDADRAAERVAVGFPQLLDLQRRTLDTQRQTLAFNKRTYIVTRSTRGLTRQTVELTRQLLALTREVRADAKRAADAADSIDRKLGGRAPLAP